MANAKTATAKRASGKKGAAMLEVSVTSSSGETGRFTATRRVKVC